MKTHYDLLGVPRNASLKEIKKAYRSLTLIYHPDKQEDHKTDEMRHINTAYEVLSDHELRRQYDLLLDSLDEHDIQPTPLGTLFLPSTGESLSSRLRKMHAKMMKHCQETVFQDQAPVHRQIRLFQLIQDKSNRQEAVLTYLPKNPGVTDCILILEAFFKGSYWGKNLLRLKGHMVQIHDQLMQDKAPQNLIAFFNAVKVLLKQTEGKPNVQMIVDALRAFDSYAMQSKGLEKQAFMQLYRTQNYRHFLKDVYLCHAQQTVPQVFSDPKEALEQLKECLKKERREEDEPEKYRAASQFASLLYRFEKSFSAIQEAEQANDANIWRDIAYQTADWFVALMPEIPIEARVQLLLQIGRCFHRAALAPNSQWIQRADQALALSQYISVLSLIDKLSMSDQIYSQLHILDGLSSLPFLDVDLSRIIRHFEKRTTPLIDFFPFYPPFMSAFSKILKPDVYEPLMQTYLHELTMLQKEQLQIQDENKQINLAFNPIDVLYMAHEASITRFYSPQHIDDVEQSVRLNLMQLLLRQKGWSLEQMQQNLTHMYKHFHADQEGYIHPVFFSKDYLSAATALKGFRFDEENGTLDLLGDKNGMERSLILLREIIVNELYVASLSLDEPDGGFKYNPFQKIRFSPPSLAHSTLGENMLATDYLLKMMTCDVQGQGFPPYAFRNNQSWIEKLPKVLQQILQTFKDGPKGESKVHRFWFSTDEVEYVENEKKNEIYILPPTIRILKNAMIRNEKGELCDDKDLEGWPLLVLTTDAVQRLHEGVDRLEMEAILLVESTMQAYFYENGRLSPQPVPMVSKLVADLLKEPREDNQEIKPTPKNAGLRFALIVDLTLKTNRDPRFSREFVLSLQLTENYGLLAQFIPIFDESIALSQLMALARLLHSRYVGVLNLYEQLVEKFPPTYWEAPLNEINAEINNWQLNQALIVGALQHPQSAYAPIFNKLREHYHQKVAAYPQILQSLYQDIQPWTFTIYSAEIINEANRWFEERKQDYLSTLKYNTGEKATYSTLPLNLKVQVDQTIIQIQNNVNQQKPYIAQQYTAQRQQNLKPQLEKIFQTLGMGDWVTPFVQANFQPLLNQYGIQRRQDGILQLKQLLSQVQSEKLHIQNKIQALDSLLKQFKLLGFGESKKQLIEEVCPLIPAMINRRLGLVYGGHLKLFDLLNRLHDQGNHLLNKPNIPFMQRKDIEQVQSQIKWKMFDLENRQRDYQQRIMPSVFSSSGFGTGGSGGNGGNNNNKGGLFDNNPFGPYPFNFVPGGLFSGSSASQFESDLLNKKPTDNPYTPVNDEEDEERRKKRHAWQEKIWMPNDNLRSESQKTSLMDILEQKTRLFFEEQARKLQEPVPVFMKTPEVFSTKRLKRGGSVRDPQVLFKEGIHARGSDMDLVKHVNGSKDSAWIPTSTSQKVALSFAGENGWLYEINPQPKAINLAKALRSAVKEGLLSKLHFYFYKTERERSVYKHIKGSDIKGAWPIRNYAVGPFMHNPYYLKPVYTPEQKLWFLGKGLSYLSMSVALTVDGLRLLDAFNFGEETGNYEPFYNAGVSMTGGWSGALTLGSCMAEMGATGCASFGPWAIAGCSLGGGLLGSYIGYMGGSDIAEWLYRFVHKTEIVEKNQNQVKNTSLRSMFFAPPKEEGTSSNVLSYENGFEFY